jgi:YD repeat-containing protein
VLPIDAANTNTITTTYDANFNPQTVTDLQNGAGSFVASYTYDSMGNVKTYTDANQKMTTFDYFQNGYLMDKIDPLGGKTSYTYDAMGQIQTVKDACGNSSCSDMVGATHTTTYTYDPLERLYTIQTPDNVTTKFLYDNNSNKTDEIDAFGTTLQRTTHYDYDSLNRVKKTTYADTTTKQFFYDFRAYFQF